ncbi:MAG: RluA family pseudouridine synthase [Coxiellaceae bacterium]|jgi:23S rRNA pseudouridine955/2504/2580 synthase|nr:RluA family pseudouridine synthase [Coxiellaceae bacterium]
MQLLLRANNIIRNRSTILVVDKEQSGQRLDNFLFNKLKNIPKSHIYKMLRSGEVRINKKRIKPLYKLQFNDFLRIPPFWVDTIVKNKPSCNLIKLLLDAIIFEDSKLLVVNKPSGIPSHGGSGINFGVIEILREARNDLKKLELVHRLDRDTSGCLILAKKKSVLRELHKLISERKMFKKYVLLVKGKWRGDELMVSLPLFKNQLVSGERIVIVSDKGKDSTTIFRPLKIYKDFSLLEAEPKTGRTHQIRVHASHIGYPVVGDDKYGNSKFNSLMKQFGLKRLFLHACQVSFVWQGGRENNFVANLDIKLINILEKLFV